MKSKKGITLIGLVIYVVAITIIVGIVATITSFFYSNTQDISDTTSSLGEYSKFNLEMIRETEQDGNSVTNVYVYSHEAEDGQDAGGNDIYSWKVSPNGIGTRIAFSSGTTFTFTAQDNGIYKNKVKICSDIINCTFSKRMQEEKEIVTVLFEMNNFAKTTEYVINNKIVANSNMEKNYTETYTQEFVKDGLLLYLDAINNTGTGHSSNTNTWYDLSGNGHDGALHNVVWAPNSAIFNGYNSWINCGEINSDYLSFVVTFSINSLLSRTQCLIANWENGGAGVYIRGGVSLFAADYGIGANNNDFKCVPDVGVTPIPSSLQLAARKTYQVAATFNGSKITLYINGTKAYESTVQTQATIRPTQTNTVMMIGENPQR